MCMCLMKHTVFIVLRLWPIYFQQLKCFHYGAFSLICFPHKKRKCLYGLALRSAPESVLHISWKLGGFIRLRVEQVIDAVLIEC